MAGTVVGNLGGFSWHKRTHKSSGTNKKCNKIGSTNHVKNHFVIKNESANDDLSSDQDNAGWRFLKSKKRESTPRKIGNTDRIEVGTDEDEKTEDLLVVFEAAKVGSNRSATSVSAQGTDQSSSKQEVIASRLGFYSQRIDSI
ncbi:hypothetical protein FGIG_12131 [Fasciola gigantica]|uniref:Uncharacterized protein n=1 Tax=Fasciola gigantica TaxID=46835 RepID=A0A504YV47_FASGI|nr:hypothetical protein FGIG_12131 [Fasciola gigantica]